MRILTTILALGLLGGTPVHGAERWQEQIASGLRKSGTELPGGVYRVSMPRTDVAVTLDGVTIKPALALGSWLAFKLMGDQAVVMGDLVLTESEVNPVLSRLEQSGIQITALHNHLLRASPATLYMHVHGHGEPFGLATALREALESSRTPLGAEAARSSSASQDQPPLDTSVIDEALGHKGKLNAGVYQVSVSRAEAVRDGGMDVPEAMGSAIAINFQPTQPGKAAITGDFVLTADEVNPVINALRLHGIEVTALHNHMLADEPRLFFMHFWGVDDVVNLAKGLRAALDKVKVAKG